MSDRAVGREEIKKAVIEIFGKEKIDAFLSGQRLGFDHPQYYLLELPSVLSTGGHRSDLAEKLQERILELYTKR